MRQAYTLGGCKPTAVTCRWITVVFVLLALLLSSLACAPSTADLPATVSSTIGTLPSFVSSAPESGVLRIWVTPFRTSPDPLHDKDRTHQAVFRLIYQGLFEVDTDHSIQPALCSTWDLSANGFFITVHLAEQARFHDGAWVAAEDVKASFDAIKSDPDSPFHERISRVNSVSVINKETIRFGLVDPGLFTLYALTFPIIPAESAARSLEGTPASLTPGTGPYEMRNVPDSSEFILKRTQASGQVREIQLVELPDIRSAVAALGDDRVDLVDLDAVDFQQYQKRKDLSIYQYAGSVYLFFSLQAEPEQPLADPPFFAYTRSLLEQVVSESVTGFSPWTPAALPATSFSCILDGGASSVGMAAWTDFARPDPLPVSRPLVLLYPSGDPLRSDLAEHVIQAFSRVGIQVRATGVDTEMLEARLTSRAYDIALLAATTSFIPDPTWLYIPDGAGALPGMSSIALASPWPESFQAAINQLRSVTSRLPVNPGWRQLRAALVACAQTAPTVGIGFVRQGMIAGHRVKGQFASMRGNPYNGIEEVWIWSGS